MQRPWRDRARQGATGRNAAVSKAAKRLRHMQGVTLTSSARTASHRSSYGVVPDEPV